MAALDYPLQAGLDWSGRMTSLLRIFSQMKTNERDPIQNCCFYKVFTELFAGSDASDRHAAALYSLKSDWFGAHEWPRSGGLFAPDYAAKTASELPCR